MSLIVLFIGTRYDVCGCNSLRDITVCSFSVIFDLHLWPSSVKVTYSSMFRCTLWCCILVPKMKLSISIEIEIWIIVWRKPFTQSSIQFLRNSNTNLPRAYKRNIPNFILIRHNRAEIHNTSMRKLTELWRKNEYCVIVTLTFNQRSLISVESKPKQ